MKYTEYKLLRIDRKESNSVCILLTSFFQLEENNYIFTQKLLPTKTFTDKALTLQFWNMNSPRQPRASINNGGPVWKARYTVVYILSFKSARGAL